MGHRTLVAYDRAGYDLHYAHWGVDPDDVTRETPFGGCPSEYEARRRAPGGIDGIDAHGGRVTEDRRTAIEPDPVATGLTFPAVCSHVDPIEHEALMVVDEEFTVRAYLAVALRGGETDGPDEDAGGSSRATAALVGYDDPADAAYVRGWIAGARTVRDDTDGGGDVVIRALRSLDPARGTLLWLADSERGGGGVYHEEQRDRDRSLGNGGER